MYQQSSRQPRQNSSNMQPRGGNMSQQPRQTLQQQQPQQQPQMAIPNMQMVPPMNQQQYPAYPYQPAAMYTTYPMNPQYQPYVAMVQHGAAGMMTQLPVGQQAPRFQAPMAPPNRMLQPRQPHVPHQKSRSRAIAIVDPNTMKEVNVAGEVVEGVASEEDSSQQLNGEAKESPKPAAEDGSLLVNGSLPDKQEDRVSPDSSSEVVQKSDESAAQEPVISPSAENPQSDLKPQDKKTKPNPKPQRAPRQEDTRQKSPSPEPPATPKSPEPSSSVSPPPVPEEPQMEEVDEDGWQEAKPRTRTSKKKADPRPVPEKMPERTPQRRKDFEKKGARGKPSAPSTPKAAAPETKPLEPTTPQPPPVFSYKDRLLGKKEERKTPEIVPEKKPEEPVKVEPKVEEQPVVKVVEKEETAKEEPVASIEPAVESKEEEIKPETEPVVVKPEPVVEEIKVEKLESKEEIEAVIEPVAPAKEIIEEEVLSKTPSDTIEAVETVKEETAESNVPSIAVEPEAKSEQAGTTLQEEEDEKLEIARSEDRVPGQKLFRSSSLDDLVYADDQWSPQNQEGKKKYESDFLRKLQNVSVSMKLPDNITLPKNILREAGASRGFQSVAGAGFTSGKENFLMPSFAAFSPKRDPRRMHDGTPKILKSISLSADVKLNESENAWKPTPRKPREDAEDASEKEDLLKKVRSILNKITPEKFDKLMGQVKEMKIDTGDKLEGVINLIFLKAIDEPGFSHMYAKMCHELSTYVRLRPSEEGQTVISFKTLLIQRCQQEYEKQNKDEVADQKKAEMLAKIEAAEGDAKKDLEMELAEVERKKRVRYVGVNRFIAELYQKSLLIPNIMLRCIRELISEKSEESLECLCKIVTTIGKDLEDKGVDLKDPINQLKQLVDKKSTSTRIRFMMQDVVELRGNGWKPRREAVKPKTMEEIAQEAKKEAEVLPPSSPMPQSNMGNYRTPSRGQDRDRDRLGDKSARNTPRPMKTVNTPFDAKKLSGLNNELSLGRPASFGQWTSGSGVSGVPKTKNVFSVLGESESDMDGPNNNLPKLKQPPRM